MISVNCLTISVNCLTISVNYLTISVKKANLFYFATVFLKKGKK